MTLLIEPRFKSNHSQNLEFVLVLNCKKPKQVLLNDISNIKYNLNLILKKFMKEIQLTKFLKKSTSHSKLILWLNFSIQINVFKIYLILCSFIVRSYLFSLLIIHWFATQVTRKFTSKVEGTMGYEDFCVFHTCGRR